MAYGELASVREIVDLSPEEVLDSARAFLVGQGYSVTQRKDSSLTVNRRTGHTSFNLTVVAQPQPQGGVRVRVHGNDQEGVQNRQAAWKKWADNLPKVRPGEQRRSSRTASEEVLAAAEGSNARVELLQDIVRIRRKGRAANKLGHLTELPLQRVASLRFKLGWSGGFIQFLPVEEENVGRWTLPPEYEVSFLYDQKEAFEEFKLAVEQRLGTQQESSEASTEATIPRSELIKNRIDELQAELERVLEEERAHEGRGNETPDTTEALEVDVNTEGGAVAAPPPSGRGEANTDRSEDAGSEDTPDELQGQFSSDEESNVVKLSSYMRDAGADSGGRDQDKISAKVVETQSLRLVNSKGQLRGMFATDENDSSIFGMCDNSGQLRAMLSMSDDSAALALLDSKKHLRVRLAVGSNDRPALDFLDDAGQLRWRMTLGAAGQPALTMMDENGIPRATFKEDSGRFLVGYVDQYEETRGAFIMDRDGTPKLMLKDAAGDIRCIIALDLDGSPTMGLFHDSEEARASLAVGDDGRPSLIFMDNNRNLRAALILQPDGSPRLTFVDQWGRAKQQGP